MLAELQGATPTDTLWPSARYRGLRLRVEPSRISLVLLLSLVALAVGCGGNPSAVGLSRKVVVLGMDGMDPRLLQRFMDEGKLPNFKRLAEQGDFRPLTTSNPPQSPVAWSNFITGMNPGGHGIFDFIHRDPSTLLPYLSTSRVEPPERTLNLGGWVVPLSSGKVSLLRQGKAFWEILAEHGTPATVYRVPANFPPVESPTRTFAGMGTPASPTILTLPSHSLKKHGSPSSGALTGHN